MSRPVIPDTPTENTEKETGEESRGTERLKKAHKGKCAVLCAHPRLTDDTG